MTLDLMLLKSLGWSDELIEAAQRSLLSVPLPVSSPVSEALITQGNLSLTSDRVEISDRHAIGSPELLVTR